MGVQGLEWHSVQKEARYGRTESFHPQGSHYEGPYSAGTVGVLVVELAQVADQVGSSCLIGLAVLLEEEEPPWSIELVVLPEVAGPSSAI